MNRIAERAKDAAEIELLFPESHCEGMKRLVKDAGLYEFRDPATGRMRTRGRKSLRPTASTMRLDRGDRVSYRAIAEWARTSAVMVEQFYDQLTPTQAAGEVATWRAKTQTQSYFQNTQGALAGERAVSAPAKGARDFMS